MLKSFKRKSTNKVQASYNYKPRNAFREEEKTVYRRISLLFVVILVLAIGLYLWGIEIVVAMGNFWRSNFPGRPNTVELPTDNPENNEPLLAPRLDPLPLYTNEDVITVKGWAQPGIEVVIFNNDQEIATLLADRSGWFEYTYNELIVGDNTFHAVTKFDEQTSEPSSSAVVHLDKTKPELQIELSEVDQEAGTIRVQGTTEPGANVYVNDHRVILQNDGSFDYQHQLTPGPNEIIVKAEDLSGNTIDIKQSFDYSPPPDEG